MDVRAVLTRTPQNVDYDRVDWDEKWDVGFERDDEERWFDEEEESELAYTYDTCE